MPRLQPPAGYTTARDAATRLGVSDGLLSRYVEQGKLKRYGPETRKHKFYKLSEIEALRETERVYTGVYERGMWRNNPSSTFDLAAESDMDAIVEISRGIFGDPPIPAAPRLAWLRKNPETFFVLRNQAGVIVGYGSLLPLKRDVIDQFICDQIEAEQITADDVEAYVPGVPLHLYIMAIGIDPRLSSKEKHAYGARLSAGLFGYLLDLAQRGIMVKTITARSHKPDGLRMLRKMGIPQLISPVPGKSLFAVTVGESGFPLFMRYSELLRKWQATYTPVSTTPPPTKKRPESAVHVPKTASTTYQDQPPDTITLKELAEHLHRSEGTLKGHIKKWDETPDHYPQFEHIKIPVPNREGQYSRYFTPPQVERWTDWIEKHTKKG